LDHAKTSSFHDFQKHSAPNLRTKKLTPKYQHFVTFVGLNFLIFLRKSSGPAKQNSWKAHIFSILFFDLKKLSQDLNDEPGMLAWTFT